MLKSLQVGRGIAAMAVLAFHLSIGIALSGADRTLGFLTWRGDLGVDFFFVLSGFIILHAHFNDINRSSRWVHYVYRRFARIYPIYLVCSALVLFIIVFSGRGLNAELHSLSSWVSDITLFRLSPDAPVLRPAWTLFHEIFFYLLFSTLILYKRIGIILLALWAGLCILLYHYPLQDNRTAFEVYTAAYNLNFFIGMGAYGLYRSGKGGRFLFFLGLMIFIATFGAESTSHMVSPLLYATSFGCLIAGSTIVEKQRSINFPAILVIIGDASYSIYLMHETIMGRFINLFSSIHLSDKIGPIPVYFMIYFITLLIGVLVYKFVEKPLLSVFRNGYFPYGRRNSATQVGSENRP